MGKVASALLAANIILFACGAGAAGNDDTCHKFFDSLHANLDTALKNKQVGVEKTKIALKGVFEKGIDSDAIARYVAGSYWNKASEQERFSFVSAYRVYLSDHYVGGLDEEDLRQLDSLAVKEFIPNPKGGYLVRTQIMRKTDEPMVFDLKLKENPPGVCHVQDFTVEGVSQIASQREEIQGLAAQGGLASVTQKLISLTHTAR